MIAPKPMQLATRWTWELKRSSSPQEVEEARTPAGEASRLLHFPSLPRGPGSFRETTAQSWADTHGRLSASHNKNGRKPTRSECLLSGSATSGALKSVVGFTRMLPFSRKSIKALINWWNVLLQLDVVWLFVDFSDQLDEFASPGVTYSTDGRKIGTN